MKDTRDMTGAELVAELTEQLRKRDADVDVLTQLLDNAQGGIAARDREIKRLTRQLAEDRAINDSLNGTISLLTWWLDEAARTRREAADA